VFISDERRFLFVHVQKTGGSTIDRRLAEVMPDGRTASRLSRHATLSEVLRREPGLSAYWTVGFVRNPWARMLSWYRMVDRFRDRVGEGRPAALQHREHNRFLREAAELYSDFESFVMQGPRRFQRLRTPQVRYLTTSTRRADMIGRQETLEADLRAVFARLELPWEPLQSRNVDSERPDYHDHYTDAMRKQVAELFMRDIDVFGYAY
jgi:hypothetical protein